jgi:radical SAM superfamily enzyme YgiQ (UPF0313 family)
MASGAVISTAPIPVGSYASTFPNEVLPHADVVVAGEAERVWPQ